VRRAVPFPPRFRSQVLVNLSAVSWHTLVLWPCFVPQPFLGSSLQSFSLMEVAHPSRGRWLPCSYRPACSRALDLAVRRAFPRRPRFHAVAWFPARLWTPFWRTEVHLPVVPGSAQRTRSVPPASPASKLCSLPETVPGTSGCPSAPGRDSPGFLPLRSVPFHTSDPRPAQVSGT